MTHLHIPDRKSSRSYCLHAPFVEPHGDASSRIVCIFVASRDGQALKIAERIKCVLAGKGVTVTVERLSPDKEDTNRPPSVLAASSALILLVAAVRYGSHLPEAHRFLARYRQTPDVAPLALASVNLSARKADRQTATDSPYLRKTIRRFGLSPILAEAFAGRLDYPRYRWFDRQLIRLIMLITGGPTDGVSVVDYTDWSQVDSFANRVAAQL